MVVRAWRWFAAVRLYGPEKLTENSERRVDRLRARSTARRRWALQWLLVFLAVLSAWFVLFSTGSLAGGHPDAAAPAGSSWALGLSGRALGVVRAVLYWQPRRGPSRRSCAVGRSRGA